MKQESLKDWMLKKIAADLHLDIDAKKLDTPFMSLGLTSAQAIKLISDLSAWLNTTIQPIVLFKYPTINKLAAYLVNADLNKVETVSNIEKILQQDADVEQANTMARHSKAILATGVLLTGANGFLGCRILEQILLQTTRMVFCLINATSENQAWEKLFKTCDNYNIDLETYRSRVICMPGDMTKPRLGLAVESWRRLCSDVSIIIHNAARVNHIYDYMQLREPNVLPLNALLELANTDYNKHISFISSVAVPYLNANRMDGATTEWYDYLPTDTSNGYATTKMVAEVKLYHAVKKDYSASVMRLPQLFGSSKNGAIDPSSDEILNFIKLCVKLEVYPDLPVAINLLPVDNAAHAIVAITCNDTVKSKIYNVINTNTVRFNDLFELLKSQGFTLCSVTLEDFITNHVSKIGTNDAFHIFKQNLTAEKFLGYNLEALQIQIDSVTAIDALGTENSSLLEFKTADILKTLHYIAPWLKNETKL